LLPAIPDSLVREAKPSGQIVPFSSLLAPTGKTLVIGVPGAFTPGCSKTHVPAYLKLHAALADLGISRTLCVSVNDPFVMQAWGQDLNIDDKVTMVADYQGNLTSDLNLSLDARASLGTWRCKRFAMVIADRRIQHMHVEPDGLGITCTLPHHLFPSLAS
ncbi:MAG: thioredoxin-like protein, partial [Piptocephalis tieghemiana]